MKQPTFNPTVPTEILRKLGLIRQRKLWVHLSSATVAALAVLLTAMALTMLIDYSATLYDSRWRFVLTFAALACAAVTAIGWIVLAGRRALSWRRVAIDVDQQVPQLQERWTTITGLGATPSDPKIVHPAMLRQVAAEAARWASRVEPERIVSLSLLRRALIGLTLITAILAVAVCLNSRQTLILLHRFWRPGAAISATELVGVPEAMVAGRGEPLLLEATVQGAPVQRAMLLLRAKDEPDRRVALVAADREPIAFSHRIRAVDEPFAFRFRAGDGQTAWCEVDVADRPEIEKMQLVVVPPAYAKQPTATFDKLPKKVGALEQSEIELALRPTIPVASIELQLGDERIKLPADDDGWYRWRTTLTAGFSLTPLLTEPHGLTNRSAPKCEFSAVHDAPPVVKVVTPNDQVAVRPDDTVQITFSASDDVGIGSAEMLVYDDSMNLGDTPIATIPIPLGNQQGARTVQQSVNLDLQQFAAKDGAQISYEIRVREDRGDATTAQNSSPPGDQPNAQPDKAMPGRTRDKANEQAGERPPSNKADESNPVAEIAPAATPANAKASAAKTTPPKDRIARNSPAPPNGSAPQSTGANAKSEQGKSSPAARQESENTAANNSSEQDAAMKSDANKEAQTPRTATTSRQSLSAEQMSEDKKTSEPTTNPSDQSVKLDAKMAQTQDPIAKTPAASSPGKPTGENNNRQPSHNGSQSAANSKESSPSSPGSSPPPDSMSRRSLDVAQSSSSQRMKLKVDQWAGSFSGQQRQKLEMAIAPELDALDKQLAKAQTTARGILDDVTASGTWRATHDREASSAQQATAEAQKIIDSLEKRSGGTPYAFVGLQVVDIGHAHVAPAHGSFWKALQSDGDDRVTSIRDASQHLARARELLAALRGQFERTRREFQLSEAIEHAKKMYQVFVENSQSLLKTFEEDPARYRRKLVEFNLDDDYIKRLQEVLEMQRDLRAELARILGDDPRLLQRFMDSVRRRSQNLREQLANLSAKQADLNREVRAWSMVEEADRPRVAQLLLLRHVAGANRIATAAGELQARYQTWLPLEQKAKDADMETVGKSTQQVASSANDLKADADALLASAQPTTGSTADATQATPPAPADQAAAPPIDRDQSIAKMQTKAQSLYAELKQLEVGLRQIAARENGANTATFATNRLLETRRLIADASAWLRQLQEHKANRYPQAAQIEQYRLAMETDQLAGKLGSIEQTLSGLMQRTDGSLPEPIANKARDFLATLDKEVTPNQLTSVYALGHNELPRAVERQKAASDGLIKAEKLYDEMIKLAIEEMDKLPVQDPIADLLNDPTLDELLAQLEQERSLQELLGIPQRPSNLRIVDDWMQGGGGGAIASGGGTVASGQMRNLGQQTQQQLDKTYRKAIARALKESTVKQKIEIPQPAKLSDWNKLVSQLEDEVQQGRDKAPPEQYRRAIEQYFAEISRAVAEQEKPAP